VVQESHPPSAISGESVVVAAREQLSCDLDGEAAILNLKNGVYYGLDPVGARIWNLIQNPTPVDTIVETLLDEYDVDAGRCREDIVGLLRQLAAQKLIEIQ